MVIACIAPNQAVQPTRRCCDLQMAVSCRTLKSIITNKRSRGQKVQDLLLQAAQSGLQSLLFCVSLCQRDPTCQQQATRPTCQQQATRLHSLPGLLVSEIAHPRQGNDRYAQSYAKDWQNAPPSLRLPALCLSSRVGSRRLCDHVLQIMQNLLPPHFTGRYVIVSQPRMHGPSRYFVVLWVQMIARFRLPNSVSKRTGEHALRPACDSAAQAVKLEEEEEEFYMLLWYDENRQVVMPKSPLIQQRNHR